MRLDCSSIKISGISWGEKTTIVNEILYIDRDQAIEACLGDNRTVSLCKVSLHLAPPGSSVRIMPVKDVIEPRCKTSEEGAIFPGVVGEMRQAGIGGTLVLKGAAVVVTINNDNKCNCQTGGFIDMNGPAAEWCYFSKTHNLVLDVGVSSELMENTPEEMDERCREMGLRLAVYLAECCKELATDSTKIYELGDASTSLPGVVYVLQMLAQNPLIKDFWVYGQLGGARFTPTIMHPNEVMDGAVTSFIGSRNTVCCDKQTTYEIQNSRVIEELYAQHGVSLRFLGVIVHNEVLTLEGKIRSSLYTTKLAKMLGAKGAILVTEGHGNPDEDLMLNCKHLEQSGIHTVIISDELAGRDGTSPGLTDWVPECNAMVSTGNIHELLAIPQKQDIFIGNVASEGLIHSAVERQPENPDLFYTEVLHIVGCENEAGFNNVSARWI